MPLIAMTREMGSLGRDVAKAVGDAFGIPVLHHEIIEPLADKMRLRKSHVIKLLDGQPSFFERLTADHTSLGGIAALLGMLNSCASGVTVVNIDNGFGAAAAASRINLLPPG